MVNYCCVPLCKNTSKSVKMHRFPADDKMCQAWIDRIGNEKLDHKSLQDVRKSYRVCDMHFDENSKIPDGKGRHGSNLKFHSLPSLHLVHATENKENDPSLSPQPGTSSMDRFGSTSAFVPHSSIPLGSDISPVVPKIQLDQKSQHATVSPSTPKGRKVLRRRTFLLKSVGAKHIGELSPRAKTLHKIASHFKRTARRLDTQLTSVTSQMKHIEKFTNSPEYIKTLVNDVTYNFIMSQLKMQKIRPRGRRYSLNDKIFALSLLKQSPRGYRLLRKVFAIPSRRTLTELLRKYPFKVGINNYSFQLLKDSVDKMEENDKYCIVIFDEMSIEPSLSYDRGSDVILGFQDNGGDSRVPAFADKAMVFMIRGALRKWKHALAYFFNDGGMKTDVLAIKLKETILNLQNIGLKVIATVCDQGGPNCSAINTLVKETEQMYCRRGEENKTCGFTIQNQEIVPLFDPPHLLKCIRNAFFEHDAIYTWRNGQKTASWKHIVKLYNAEDNDSDYKMCHKLTDMHINNTKKMKVSVATQVLSNRVAAAMKFLAVHGTNILPPDAVDTAEFVLFMDKLFDSVNGSRINCKDGKYLRTAVTATSMHSQFWIDAIQVLQSIKFVNSKRIITLKNWVTTLKGFRYLCKKLLNESITFICTRNFNQDPLENFFGAIRSHGVRNINPSCNSFVNSFKSLIINNYTSSHSPSANCEEDALKGLCTLKKVLQQCPVEEEDSSKEVEVIIVEEKKEPDAVEKGKLCYLSGYVAKKLLKKTKMCKQCKKDMLGDRQDLRPEERHFIEARAFNVNALLSPNTNYMKVFTETIHVLSTLLPKVCHKKNVKFNLKLNVMANLDDTTLFTCSFHNLLDIFLDFVCTFHIYTWCENINKILKGKDNLRNKNYKDPVKYLAYNKYKKFRGAHLKIKQTKRIIE